MGNHLANGQNSLGDGNSPGTRPSAPPWDDLGWPVVHILVPLVDGWGLDVVPPHLVRYWVGPSHQVLSLTAPVKPLGPKCLQEQGIYVHSGPHLALPMFL